jgi:hypothetical protein
MSFINNATTCTSLTSAKKIKYLIEVKIKFETVSFRIELKEVKILLEIFSSGNLLCEDKN